MKELISLLSSINLLDSLIETLLMTFISCACAYVLGIPIGVLMVITDKDGLHPNGIIHKILSVIVNLGRSIPFLILLVLLIPFTKIIVGTSLGVRGMIVPLVIGSTPFIARLVEQSLREIPKGVIDAAVCMGASNLQIIMRVYLKECIPSLIRGVSIALITLVGYSAMSGTVGGGGLGYTAVYQGHYNFRTDVMIIVLIVLIIVVQVIQTCFDYLAKKIDKRKGN